MLEQRGKFYYIESEDIDNKEWWLVFHSKRFPEDIPEFYRKLHNGMQPDDVVMSLRVYHGRRPPDCLGGTGDWIVSSRIRDIFVRHRIGNARFVPVIVYDKKDRKVLSKDYWCVLPDVGAGPADESAGYYKLITPGAWRKDPTLHDAYGVHFDHSTWTGLDVFKLPASVPLIVTKSIFDELAAAKLAGARIGDILDYAKDRRDLKAPLTMEAAHREGIIVAPPSVATEHRLSKDGRRK
jgi:hypothetical protein